MDLSNRGCTVEELEAILAMEIARSEKLVADTATAEKKLDDDMAEVAANHEEIVRQLAAVRAAMSKANKSNELFMDGLCGLAKSLVDIKRQQAEETKRRKDELKAVTDSLKDFEKKERISEEKDRIGRESDAMRDKVNQVKAKLATMRADERRSCAEFKRVVDQEHAKIAFIKEQIKEAENQRIQCLSMQADLQAKFFRDDHNDGAGEGSAPVA